MDPLSRLALLTNASQPDARRPGRVVSTLALLCALIWLARGMPARGDQPPPPPDGGEPAAASDDDADPAKADTEGEDDPAEADTEGEDDPAKADTEGEDDPAKADTEGEDDPADADTEGEDDPADADTEGEDEEILSDQDTEGEDEKALSDQAVAEVETEAPPEPSRVDAAEGVDEQIERQRVDQPRGLFQLGPITILSREFGRFNDRLEEDLGLRFGLAYTVLYQVASDGIGPTSAASGDFDFSGRWRLFENESDRGQFGFLLENRHRFTEISPARLNRSIGSIWRTTRGFSDFDFTLRELWWDQKLFDERLVFRVGVINQKHFVDLYTFKSQNFYFLSSPYSDSPTIAFPTNGFGAMVRVQPLEDLHVTGTFGDANGDNFDRFSGFGEHEFYTAIDVALTPELEGIGRGKFGVTAWHIDAREQQGTPSGRGFSFVAEQEIAKNFYPFARYGYGDGANLVMEHVVAAGVGLRRPFGQKTDAAGVGFSWARPSVSLLDDQWGMEAFYRIQLTEAIQLTPGFQLILDPAFNPSEDVVGLFQLRLRVQF